MVVKRHYNADGSPAYVTVYLKASGGVLRLSRLVYPKAAEFERLWMLGVEVVQGGT